MESGERDKLNFFIYLIFLKEIYLILNKPKLKSIIFYVYTSNFF